MRRPVAVVLVATALAASAACSSSAPNAHGRILVLAGENFWGDIARQVGGRRVQVTSIISEPAADPHLYESDARDAEALADARVVIENGLGYDDFMGKLLSATSSDNRTVIDAARVAPALPSDANPHVWYDLSRVRSVAAAIEQALAHAQPTHAREFTANRVRFDRSLQPIETVVTTIKRRFPGAPVAYTERVPGYLLQAAQLDIRTPVGFARAIEDGNEPSAGDTQSMRTLISTHHIRVLLYNAQATSAVTRRVRSDARRAGIPVVPVTETMPHNAASYQAWQLRQANALLRALQQSGQR